MRWLLQWLAATAFALGTPVAEASFHQFRIEQLFSNADGSVQFVVMHEAFGGNGENFWAGQQLRVTDSRGISQAITFSTNLPSSNTANRRVLIATPAFAALGIVTPDYSIPARFLPTDGGTLDYAAGVHRITFSALPTDGATALMASGVAVANVATNFAGVSGSVAPAAGIATVVEFYNAALDHYFITHIAPEIATLDAGVTIKGWARTGQSFNVFTTASGTSAVCRFYIPPDKGNSHFYGRGSAECDATGKSNPSFINEDPQFFYVVLPTLGVCPVGTTPVYRVFSNRADANHRYMIDRTIRDQMASVRGWLPEGDGPDLVVMCVPAAPASASDPAPSPPDPPMPPYPGYPG